MDPSGNGPGSSELLSFTTGASADRTAPRISDVKASGITDSLAVISWTTDEPGNSLLELGPGPAYNRLLSSDRFEMTHSVVVTGLLAGKEYHFRVGSADTSGNGPSYSDDSTFTTLLVKDTTPPAIQSTRVITAGQDNVTLEVVLSEPGTVLVDFGEGRAYGKTAGSYQFRSTHILTITGLEPGRTYHFRVSAMDASGNGPTTGGDQTFKTKARAVQPGNFALTTESIPYIFLVIVVLAVALTLGIYFIGKRGGRGKAEMPSTAQHPLRASDNGTTTAESPQAPDSHERRPPNIAPPSMTVVKKVDAAELEDED